MLQGACLGGSVQRIRAQCIVLLHGSFARALSAPRAAHEAAACFPAPMNESAHALCWRAPAHCARRMRRVRGSFIATCCTCGESESVCLFCGVVSGVPVHDLCVWCVCVYVCIRRGTQRERPQNAQRAKPAGNGQKTRAGATRAQSAHTRGRDGPLRPTGRCVQSWVAHHGVRGGAPEEIFAYTTIFRAKNACSENVKHLVQKLSSRDLHESGHTA